MYPSIDVATGCALFYRKEEKEPDGWSTFGFEAKLRQAASYVVGALRRVRQMYRAALRIRSERGVSAPTPIATPTRMSNCKRKRRWLSAHLRN